MFSSYLPQRVFFSPLKIAINQAWTSRCGFVVIPWHERMVYSMLSCNPQGNFVVSKDSKKIVSSYNSALEVSIYSPLTLRRISDFPAAVVARMSSPPSLRPLRIVNLHSSDLDPPRTYSRPRHSSSPELVLLSTLPPSFPPSPFSAA
jgi:hypothetical protein